MIKEQIKTPTPKELSKFLKTNNVEGLVNEYLIQTAYAQILREKVDKIWNDLLIEYPIFYDEKWEEGRKRILSRKDLCMAKDEDFTKIWKMVNVIQVQKGLQTKEKIEYCPASIAENEAIKIKKKFVNLIAPFFGMNPDYVNMVEDIDKLVNLTVSLIVSQKDYKSPL